MEAGALMLDTSGITQEASDNFGEGRKVFLAGGPKT